MLSCQYVMLPCIYLKIETHIETVTTVVSETLDNVAQRRGESPILGGIQHQASQGSEHPHLVVGVHIHCRDLD